VQTGRHRAGLIVDSVSAVMRTTADAIKDAPDLTEDIARLVHGVINIESKGRIILVLDPAELLTRAELGLLDKFESSAQAPS
jgi:purine-binding chemotaxis protein CheW